MPNLNDPEDYPAVMLVLVLFGFALLVWAIHWLP